MESSNFPTPPPSISPQPISCAEGAPLDSNLPSPSEDPMPVLKQEKAGPRDDKEDSRDAQGGMEGNEPRTGSDALEKALPALPQDATGAAEPPSVLTTVLVSPSSTEKKAKSRLVGEYYSPNGFVPVDVISAREIFRQEPKPGSSTDSTATPNRPGVTESRKYLPVSCHSTMDTEITNPNSPSPPSSISPQLPSGFDVDPPSMQAKHTISSDSAESVTPDEEESDTHSSDSFTNTREMYEANAVRTSILPAAPVFNKRRSASANPTDSRASSLQTRSRSLSPVRIHSSSDSEKPVVSLPTTMSLGEDFLPIHPVLSNQEFAIAELYNRSHVLAILHTLIQTVASTESEEPDDFSSTESESKAALASPALDEQEPMDKDVDADEMEGNPDLFDIQEPTKPGPSECADSVEASETASETSVPAIPIVKAKNPRKYKKTAGDEEDETGAARSDAAAFASSARKPRAPKVAEIPPAKKRKQRKRWNKTRSGSPSSDEESDEEYVPAGAKKTKRKGSPSPQIELPMWEQTMRRQAADEAKKKLKRKPKPDPKFSVVMYESTEEGEYDTVDTIEVKKGLCTPLQVGGKSSILDPSNKEDTKAWRVEILGFCEIETDGDAVYNDAFNNIISVRDGKRRARQEKARAKVKADEAEELLQHQLLQAAHGNGQPPDDQDDGSQPGGYKMLTAYC